MKKIAVEKALSYSFEDNFINQMANILQSMYNLNKDFENVKKPSRLEKCMANAPLYLKNKM
ncbi:hypothetical protein M33023_00590 [Candidatus Phytoplasma asteris]|uniref:Uncharacterized protein n=2 Tax=16SrI (Aster yellows group) TaxID=3042590 RepID=Q2NK68_AYWBP|nr:hypothetical protein [Aster yellows witches'-broom phytoplasma]ABC65175.1 hypothetical protein AYWB_058 [Aster yellows witches'-broom phytoplasma AYWB]